MFRNATPVSRRRAFALILGLALVPAAAAPAAAASNCKKVHSHLFLAASTAPGCTSPIGLCAGATLRGSLKATTEFVGTSFLPTVDTAISAVVVLTGDNTFHTDGGDFYTKDAIVLSTVGAGEFAEVDTVIGGTGEWAGATGNLTATGTFANGIGEGIIEGEICVP
jgi:hypothetical protein